MQFFNQGPPKWEKGADGFFYIFYKKPKSFKQAQATCKRRGGHLAMEKTTATRNYIIKKYPNKDFFVGCIRNPKNKSQFIYIDNTKIKRAYWMKGEPNNQKGKESCVHHTQNNQWNDVVCTIPRKFLCQKGKHGHSILGKNDSWENLLKKFWLAKTFAPIALDAFGHSDYELSIVM